MVTTLDKTLLYCFLTRKLKANIRSQHPSAYLIQHHLRVIVCRHKHICDVCTLLAFCLNKHTGLKKNQNNLHIVSCAVFRVWWACAVPLWPCGLLCLGLWLSPITHTLRMHWTHTHINTHVTCRGPHTLLWLSDPYPGLQSNHSMASDWSQDRDNVTYNNTKALLMSSGKFPRLRLM